MRFFRKLLQTSQCGPREIITVRLQHAVRPGTGLRDALGVDVPSALQPIADYSSDNSYAVANKNFGQVQMSVTGLGGAIQIQTSALRIVINKAPYGISVYRGNQLIHADTPPCLYQRIRFRRPAD
jgi:hypothetical protein